MGFHWLLMCAGGQVQHTEQETPVSVGDSNKLLHSLQKPPTGLSKLGHMLKTLRAFSRFSHVCKEGKQTLASLLQIYEEDDQVSAEGHYMCYNVVGACKHLRMRSDLYECLQICTGEYGVVREGCLNV